MARKPKPADPSAPADLTIVYVDPRKLTPYANNARTHSPDQVRQIRGSIDEFGFNNPILLKDDGHTIGAGHGRQLASLLEPVFERVPAVILRGLSDAQWRAYVIADNKHALNAGWDLDLLRAELQSLQAVGFSLELTGFGSMELADIFATKTGRTGPDEAPPLEKVEISVPGNMWLLGGHRLLCGDSTDPMVARALLLEDKPGLMVTDPPYGVDYDPSWRAAATGQKVRNSGRVHNDDRFDWREAWEQFPGSTAYVWHAGKFGAGVQISLESSGFELRSQIIWVKDRFALSRGHYHWRHEPLFYMVRKGAKPTWQGGRKKDTVWRIDGLEPAEAKVIAAQLAQDGLEQTVWEIPMSVDDGATGHGTQKPVECMRRPIENNSKPGDLVYDPFMGSGTTLIAAEMTGRKCLGLELAPGYVDVAVRRWQNFTGKTAVLDGTGMAFNDVALKRSPKAA